MSGEASRGGVGKTTLTANLAGVIAAKAERTVLAVDLDAQRNLGTALGIDIAAAPPEPPGVIPTGRDRYSYAAWDLPAGVEAEALSAAFDAVNADIALLDTPPSATCPWPTPLSPWRAGWSSPPAATGTPSTGSPPSSPGR